MKKTIKLGEETKFGTKEMEVRLLPQIVVQFRPWDGPFFELENQEEVLNNLEEYFREKKDFDVELKTDDGVNHTFFSQGSNIFLLTYNNKSYKISKEDLWKLYELLEWAIYYE